MTAIGYALALASTALALADVLWLKGRSAAAQFALLALLLAAISLLQVWWLIPVVLMLAAWRWLAVREER
jgi:hypothetical protein